MSADIQTREIERRKRRQAERRGRMAEILCRMLLRLKGYKILEQRYRRRNGEIDIIASRGNVLAFIEVKARDDVVAALEAVTPRNRRRVINAATAFILQNPDYAGLYLRFDVMYVTSFRGMAFSLPRHICGAWKCDDDFGVI